MVEGCARKSLIRLGNEKPTKLFRNMTKPQYKIKHKIHKAEIFRLKSHTAVCWQSLVDLDVLLSM